MRTRTSDGDPVADAELARRARRHAALGEPVRLAIVERLLLTDASPGELGATFALATNVLAHHLKVLQASGLVRRVRSEGDARRAYLRLRLDDPEVAALLAGQPASGATARPRRVLFVCTHNCARSQLAAAAWQRISELPVTSAGTHPASQVHPRAVAVGRRHGLRLAGSRTSNLIDVATAGDLIICVCDNAHEELTAQAVPIGNGPAARIHWAVPDPVRVDTDDAFETAYAELARRVERLARTLDRPRAAGA